MEPKRKCHNRVQPVRHGTQLVIHEQEKTQEIVIIVSHRWKVGAKVLNAFPKLLHDTDAARSTIQFYKLRSIRFDSIRFDSLCVENVERIHYYVEMGESNKSMNGIDDLFFLSPLVMRSRYIRLIRIYQSNDI